MARSNSHSPLLYQYLKKYQEDPTSRVFAPLAEAYRKAGLLDEAVDIAREGLRIHPSFIGGRVALARALHEKRLHDEVIDELEPVVRDAPDNLVAQRLLAESYLIRGRVNDALGAYKMLLYFVPSDMETAKIVQELENQAYSQGDLVLRTDPEPLPQFEEKSLDAAISSNPAEKRDVWVRRIEVLQLMLQRVERYRSRVRLTQARSLPNR